MEIQIITDSVDYSIAEFYEHFHADIPLVVQVSQGFQGHIIEDTFGKGEILYIAAISKQKRVAAKAHTKGSHRVLSIPQGFSDNLCIRRFGKAGHEQTMSDILKHNRLPVTVQYPPNDIIIFGNKRFNSSNIPRLEIVKAFEEIYLLGNYLTDGKLGKEIIHLPLYLSQLRLRLVTGIKGLTEEGWVRHCDALMEESKQIEYDLLFGNQYVAEYDHSDISPNTKYAYIEPLHYDDMFNLMLRWPECHLGGQSRDSSSSSSSSSSTGKDKQYVTHEMGGT
ncbi:uncharacterized protein LOC132728112 [Ruditapes philippinarum]|uniref:uncharacterized protein LOC132728112 n=1 Tax=Ruditapes philippinarum TaxID=129788 RepID=UPI00295B3C45|nr:uncharacterized protein LOC132728112 [Ruditapes philippinarum]